MSCAATVLTVSTARACLSHGMIAAPPRVRYVGRRVKVRMGRGGIHSLEFHINMLISMICSTVVSGHISRLRCPSDAITVLKIHLSNLLPFTTKNSSENDNIT